MQDRDQPIKMPLNAEKQRKTGLSVLYAYQKSNVLGEMIHSGQRNSLNLKSNILSVSSNCGLGRLRLFTVAELVEGGGRVCIKEITSFVAMSLGVWKSSKKTIKFVVDFHLEELSSVPFLAGVIFAKLRLLSGGNFRKISDREEIVDHRVCWNSHFEFECKLTATLSTGTLDACTCRVSVRRESQGGKSYQKLGFADINLAEFAGGTPQSRSFLLEEYNSSTRANNALLRVTLCMRVKEGDFCFKVPQPSAPSSTFFSETLTFPEKTEHAEQPQIEKETTQGDHSRQSSSSDSGVVSREIASEYGSLERNSGRNSALSSGPILDREKVGSSRVDSTRVDPENLIDQLLRESNLESSPNEGGGLTLFIGKDGSAAVVGD